MSEIDDSNRIVGEGWAPDIHDYVQPLLVNPITGKLKIEIIPKALSTPYVITHPNIPIDENTRNVAGAMMGGRIMPLSVDLIQGFACLRITD